MTDEKILAVYQQVRSRYDFFDYLKKVTEANQTLDASDPFINASKLWAKADEALNRDVVVAFAKEIALWREAESWLQQAARFLGPTNNQPTPPPEAA
jgi:hypothetical protein